MKHFNNLYCLYSQNSFFKIQIIDKSNNEVVYFIQMRIQSKYAYK